MGYNYLVVSSGESIEQQRLLEDLKSSKRGGLCNYLFIDEYFKELGIDKPQNAIEENAYRKELLSLIRSADSIAVDLRNTNSDVAFILGSFCALNRRYNSLSKDIIILDGKEKDINEFNDLVVRFMGALDYTSSSDNYDLYFISSVESAIEAVKNHSNDKAKFLFCLDEDEFEDNFILGFITALVPEDSTIGYTSKRTRPKSILRKLAFTNIYNHRPTREELDYELPKIVKKNYKNWDKID